MSPINFTLECSFQANCFEFLVRTYLQAQFLKVTFYMCFMTFPMASRFLLLSLFFSGLIMTPVWAQKGHFSIGGKGGYNASNLRIQEGFDLHDKRVFSSFHLLLYAEYGLSQSVYLQPGISLTGKGADFVVGNRRSDTWMEVRTNPIYLEIPINVLYKRHIGNRSNLFAGGGPYAAYGVSGKTMVKSMTAGVPAATDDDIEYSNNDFPATPPNQYMSSLKPFDAGVNVLAGVEISRLTLNVQYGMGLVNIRPAQTGRKTEYRNSVISFSLGLLF